MDRAEAVSRIKANAEAIHALGAGGLHLYGSVANETSGPASDVDILVDRDPDGRCGFIELTELQFLLDEILCVDVDLSTRSGLHPALSETIERSAIRVL